MKMNRERIPLPRISAPGLDLTSSAVPQLPLFGIILQSPDSSHVADGSEEWQLCHPSDIHRATMKTCDLHWHQDGQLLPDGPNGDCL